MSCCRFHLAIAVKDIDEAKNNTALGIIAFGEGWHNNHHAFPYSAKQGLQGQFDLTWYVIVALKKLGLAKDIRLPI